MRPSYPGRVTLQELANRLGVSKDVVKRRLALMRTMGLDGARRDVRGALVISDDAVALLQRALALERDGLQARVALLQALREAHPAPATSAPAPQTPTGGTDGRTAVRASDPYLPVLWVLATALTLGVLGLLAACFLALFLR